MAYELKQELKLTQKLMLTPQLQLAIKLLQLSRQELVDMVREEVDQNPVLDEQPSVDTAVPEPPSASSETEKNEIDWESYVEHHEDFSGRRSLDFSTNTDEDSYFEKAQFSSPTLREHLLWQLRLLGLDAGDIDIGEFIIGNIDEDGYLRIVDTPEKGSDYEQCREAAIMEIGSSLGVEPGRVAPVLETVQQMDPVGVGGTSTIECLLLQAERLPVRDPLVIEIIKNHLGMLANKNYRAIARARRVDMDRVLGVVKVITEALNPMPGAGYGTDESRVVIPDVYVQKVEDEYVVTLNDDGLPRLKISPYYKKMLGSNGALGAETKSYVQERLRSAAWLIRSVHQRQRTIKKVVESIVGFQKDFLDKGLMHLKPIVLRDVAESIGMHESTISRVTSNKYVHTPRGIFELKYFFSTAMTRTDGSDVTAEYIKDRIKSIIDGEDPGAPLSDQRIAAIFKEQDVVVARRTVAKYREDVGYLSSSKRKSRY